MRNGYGERRFKDEKRTFEKPIAISSQVLLDRERCVLCARCTRFSQQIAGDPFIELFERGALEQVAIYTDEPFHSYFSGNTVQICPVGALTDGEQRAAGEPEQAVAGDAEGGGHGVSRAAASRTALVAASAMGQRHDG